MKLEKLYFDSSPEFLLSLTADNLVENASNTLLETLETTQRVMFGFPLLKFIVEEEMAGFQKFLTYGRIGEKQVFKWKMQDGQSKPFRFKLSLRSPNGLILKLEDPGALNNKWGKKIVNEQILQLLLNLIPFPLFVKNSASEYVLLNQAQADLFGLTMAEMIGKSDEVYIKDEKELALVRQSDKDVFDSLKKTVISDQQFTTPNGKMYILETIKVPFINDVTGETNILGVSIDNTERKLAEAALTKTNLERDNLIHKVTQDLKPILDLLNASMLEKVDVGSEMKTSISKVSGLLKEMSAYSKN